MSGVGGYWFESSIAHFDILAFSPRRTGELRSRDAGLSPAFNSDVSRLGKCPASGDLVVRVVLMGYVAG